MSFGYHYITRQLYFLLWKYGGLNSRGLNYVPLLCGHATVLLVLTHISGINRHSPYFLGSQFFNSHMVIIPGYYLRQRGTLALTENPPPRKMYNGELYARCQN